jgi:hypothetical protein
VPAEFTEEAIDFRLDGLAQGAAFNNSTPAFLDAVALGLPTASSGRITEAM